MKNKYLNKAVLYCIIVLCSSIQVIRAQQVKGVVVTEDGAMPGVIVGLVSQDKYASTELDGSFSLVSNHEGECELSLSFIGYADKFIKINIGKGINNLGVIALESDTSMMDEVVITSSRANSQAKAYSIKMNSQAIMDVVAADAMGKLPDKNAAEAVQRIQGVAVARYHGEANAATVRGTPFNWTSTVLNGNRLPSTNVYGARSAVLDVIPAELIQYVQVSKAITPDMEGDAIGGAINFVTRTAPFSKKLGGNLAAGYSHFTNKATYNGALVYGDRFLDNKLGVILVGALWDRQIGSDVFNVKYNLGSSNESERNAINNVALTRIMGQRQTYGLNLGLEYEFDDKNKIYFRGMYNKFNDIRPVSESYIDYSKSRYQYSYRFAYYKTRLTGGELGGTHDLSDKTTLDWSVSNYASNYFLDTPSTSDKKGTPLANFYQPITGGFNNLSKDGLMYWGFDGGNAGYNALKFNPNLANPNELINPEKLVLNNISIVQLDNKEDDKTAQFNLKSEFSDKFSIKGGAKFKTKLRNSTFGSIYTYAGQGDKLSDLTTERFIQGNGFFNNLKGDYNYNDLIVNPLTEWQLNQLFTNEYLTSHGFKDYTSPTNSTNLYEARENIYAAYIMGTYKINNQLTLTAGIRNEYTTTKLTGTKATKGQTEKEITLSPSKINNDYNVFMPMLHLRYNLDEHSNVRFAYTKTFNRANFGDMTPGESINTTGTDVVITRGNPDLKPTISNNFDLMYEKYFDNVGLLSGGVFYKKINNVIFTNETQFNQNNNAFIMKEAKNLEDANVIGVELGMNRRFDFLPGFWSGFGIEANYTFIDSKVNVPRQYKENDKLVTVSDKTSLPDQSKHLGNIILFYEKGKIMVRIAGNYRGASINAINQNLGKNYYVWTDSNFTLDASATFTLNKKVKFFLELNNLTNEPLKQYMGDKRRVTSYQWYGVKGQIGARIDIF